MEDTKEPVKGITRGFFSQPIIVPCSFVETFIEDGKARQELRETFFSFKRETQGDSEASAIASVNGNAQANRLTRFCILLTEAPSGYVDFPSDERPLPERVAEYFGGDEMAVLVKGVLETYDRLKLPLEFYRSV